MLCLILIQVPHCEDEKPTKILAHKCSPSTWDPLSLGTSFPSFAIEETGLRECPLEVAVTLVWCLPNMAGFMCPLPPPPTQLEPFWPKFLTLCMVHQLDPLNKPSGETCRDPYFGWPTDSCTWPVMWRPSFTYIISLLGHLVQVFMHIEC